MSRTELGELVRKAASMLSRAEFAAEYLVYITRDPRERANAGGWEVERVPNIYKVGDWNIEFTVRHGIDTRYFTVAQVCNFPPLAPYVEQADNFRQDVLEVLARG